MAPLGAISARTDWRIPRRPRRVFRSAWKLSEKFYWVTALVLAILGTGALALSKLGVDRLPGTLTWRSDSGTNPSFQFGLMVVASIVGTIVLATFFLRVRRRFGSGGAGRCLTGSSTFARRCRSPGSSRASGRRRTLFQQTWTGACRSYSSCSGGEPRSAWPFVFGPVAVTGSFSGCVVVRRLSHAQP